VLHAENVAHQLLSTMNRPAMYPNKLCYQREIDRNKRIHARRLKNMKSTNRTNSAKLMDNRPPRRFKHLQQNLKKRQLEEERYFQIERENKLLMQKVCAMGVGTWQQRVRHMRYVSVLTP